MPLTNNEENASILFADWTSLQTAPLCRDVTGIVPRLQLTHHSLTIAPSNDKTNQTHATSQLAFITQGCEVDASQQCKCWLVILKQVVTWWAG